jgi:hypothetical protein
MAKRASHSPNLTPTGLTTMLREAGALTQGTVTSVDITQRLNTTVSSLWFATITYGPNASRLPSHVVVKWPLERTPAPDRGLPELEFYTKLSPALRSPPIVRCVAAAPDSIGLQWLVLEDLRDTHTNPQWPHPPTRSEAESAVSALAHVHARWWEAPTLGTEIGVLHSHASLREMVNGVAGQLSVFIDTLVDALSPRDQRLLETVFASSLSPWLRLTDPRALTVTHGDAHTWNFLFPRSGMGAAYLIDWQLWHVDVGARDLAFMIALHWDSSLRAALERPLLELYHRRLVDAGVATYSFDDLWLDYRRCVVRNLTVPIIMWRRGLPSEAWRHRLDCALAAYRDLHGDDFL